MSILPAGSKRPQRQTTTAQLIFLRLPSLQSSQLRLLTTFRRACVSQMSEFPCKLFLSRGSFPRHSPRSPSYLVKMIESSGCQPGQNLSVMMSKLRLTTKTSPSGGRCPCLNRDLRLNHCVEDASIYSSITIP